MSAADRGGGADDGGHHTPAAGGTSSRRREGEHDVSPWLAAVSPNEASVLTGLMETRRPRARCDTNVIKLTYSTCRHQFVIVPSSTPARETEPMADVDPPGGDSDAATGGGHAGGAHPRRRRRQPIPRAGPQARRATRAAARSSSGPSTHAMTAGIGPVVVVTGAAARRRASTRASSTSSTSRWADGQSTSLRAGIAAAARSRRRRRAGRPRGPAVRPPSAWRRVAAADAPIVVATYHGRRGHPVRLHAVDLAAAAGHRRRGRSHRVGPSSRSRD